MKFTSLIVALTLLSSGQAVAKTLRVHDASWAEAVKKLYAEGGKRSRHCLNSPPRCYENLVGTSEGMIVQLSEMYNAQGVLESRFAIIYRSGVDIASASDWDTNERTEMVNVNGVWEVARP